MTNTKSHEDLSCSVETDAPQNRTATAEADLSSVLDETNDEDSGESSAANSADVIEDIETTPPVSEFEGFGFSEPLLNTLAAKGYKHPSPIQKAAFPELMLGR
ncbi:MAG TPA: DEAD/DEAH box helicase, partial [Prochlorococcaceae cyanobacterium Fu_MAG_134]|nr:DEAD/DEAH box helicase [Prochlorococcaceae cyanobacterium Fu_MAG_134]